MTGRAARVPVAAAPLLAALSAGGCGGGSLGSLPAASPAADPPAAALLPSGLGTLRQDDFTLTLTAGPLQVKVTPLDPRVLPLAAPDTEARLSALARSHGGGEASEGEPSLFLVSFHALEGGASFVPEGLTLNAGGVRHRPSSIRPITPTWSTRRLEARETASAVYHFPQWVDVRQPFSLEYEGWVEGGWAAVLPLLQREEARVRARGGIGSDGAPREGARRTP